MTVTENTYVESATIGRPPTAAELAEQAAALRTKAIEQAEQDVKDAEKAVTDTTQARADAMRARAAARQALREIKAGSKAPKPGAGETRKPRKPRGASPTAVAGALGTNEHDTLTN